MMEKSNISLPARSDTAILEMIGRYIRETRLRENISQDETAAAAGINRSTLVQLENGKGSTMLSFIQVMRALQQLHMFSGFEVKQVLSPLQLAKMEQQKRKRAGKTGSQTGSSTSSAW